MMAAEKRQKQVRMHQSHPVCARPYPASCHATVIACDFIRKIADNPVTTNAALSQYRPVTRYTYDNLGNLIAVTAGQTDITGTNSGADVVATQMTYVYDDFSRKLKETDPLNRSWSYLYDINNNVTRVTDAKNQATQYTWNPGHQLVSMKDASGKTTTYIRNPLGQVLTVQTPDVSTGYAYDQTHRLASATDNRAASARVAAAKTLNYSYSPGGLLNTLTDSEGNRTDYLYDPTGRLDGIWAPNLDYVSYTYDAGGRLTEKWFPNGINTQYAYNSDNTLTQLTNRIGYSAAATVTNHRYTYDGVGNRKTGQDQAGPLQSPVMNQASSYDPLNNRLTQSDGTTTLYAQYDAANQLTGLHQGSLTGPLTAAYIYDANGSLTQKCEGGAITQTATSCTGNVITTLTWDAQNRLIQADKTGQPTQTYAYDDQGRRIRKSVGTTTTNYLYNGPDIYAEYTSWTAPNALYTDGPNTDEPVIRLTTSGAQYYHQDGLGSVVAMTDATGNLTGAQLYDAWGNTQVATGSISQYGYTGREPDETGLIYYRARYYDPSIGRFTSRDPSGNMGIVPKFSSAAISAIGRYFGKAAVTAGAGSVVRTALTTGTIGGVSSTAGYLATEQNPTFQGVVTNGGVGFATGAIIPFLPEATGFLANARNGAALAGMGDIAVQQINMKLNPNESFKPLEVLGAALGGRLTLGLTKDFGPSFAEQVSAGLIGFAPSTAGAAVGVRLSEPSKGCGQQTLSTISPH